MQKIIFIGFGIWLMGFGVVEANTDGVCNDANGNFVQTISCPDSVSLADCLASCPGAGPPPQPPGPPPPPPTGAPPGTPFPPITPPITPPTPCIPTSPDPMTGVGGNDCGGMGGMGGGGPTCTDSTETGDWGSCEGAFGPWDTVSHTRRYEGTECRTITTTSSCGGSDSRQDCRPCGYEQSDTISPTCEAVVDWQSRPLESVVLNCEDDLSGCDEATYENGERNVARTEVLSARACDAAGNCVDCPITNPDDIAPTCTATFLHPGRWHRDDNFEVNGGPVRCWLESCEDEGPSGCLPLGTLENTEKTYSDVGGMREEVQVEQDPIEPIHRDTCQILVCDNAGNCDTCESSEIAYDGTNVCRAADQNCSNCGEDDWDCQCIAGDRSKCTDSGPVNCYADPFNLRCPGFENEACMSNNFIPGCPVFNPCYPETNRDHPRAGGVDCPADAIRFCSRNPYHYGCNEACKLGLIECDPDVPEGELLSSRLESPASRVQSADVDRPDCPALGDCPRGWNWVRDGVDEDGCVLARCEEQEQAEIVENLVAEAEVLAIEDENEALQQRADDAQTALDDARVNLDQANQQLAGIPETIPLTTEETREALRVNREQYATEIANFIECKRRVSSADIPDISATTIARASIEAWVSGDSAQHIVNYVFGGDTCFQDNIQNQLTRPNPDFTAAQLAVENAEQALQQAELDAVLRELTQARNGLERAQTDLERASQALTAGEDAQWPPHDVIQPVVGTDRTLSAVGQCMVTAIQNEYGATVTNYGPNAAPYLVEHWRRDPTLPLLTQNNALAWELNDLIQDAGKERVDTVLKNSGCIDNLRIPNPNLPQLQGAVDAAEGTVAFAEIEVFRQEERLAQLDVDEEIKTQALADLVARDEQARERARVQQELQLAQATLDTARAQAQRARQQLAQAEVVAWPAHDELRSQVEVSLNNYDNTSRCIRDELVIGHGDRVVGEDPSIAMSMLMVAWSVQNYENIQGMITNLNTGLVDGYIKDTGCIDHLQPQTPALTQAQSAVTQAESAVTQAQTEVDNKQAELEQLP